MTPTRACRVRKQSMSRAACPGRDSVDARAADVDSCMRLACPSCPTPERRIAGLKPHYYSNEVLSDGTPVERRWHRIRGLSVALVTTAAASLVALGLPSALGPGAPWMLSVVGDCAGRPRVVAPGRRADPAHGDGAIWRHSGAAQSHTRHLDTSRGLRRGRRRQHSGKPAARTRCRLGRGHGSVVCDGGRVDVGRAARGCAGTWAGILAWHRTVAPHALPDCRLAALLRHPGSRDRHRWRTARGAGRQGGAT